MRYTLELFKRHGYLAKDVEAVTLKVGTEALTFSQYSQLNDAAKRVCTLPVVVDAPSWFGLEEFNGKKRILSFSDKSRRLARWQEGTGKVGIYKITDKGFQLVDNFQLLQVAERTETMAEKFNWDESFQEALNETVPENNGSTAQNVNAFGNGNDNGNGSGATTATKPVSKASAIKEQLSGVQFNNAALASYARRLGSLLFYVVGKDAAVKPTARMETKVVDGKTVYKSGVSEERKQKIERGEAKPTSNEVEREYNVRLVESKPTKVTDVVIALPASLAKFSPSEVWEARGNVPYDVKDTTLVKKIYPLEQAFDVINMYFDGTIYESKQVLGNKASTIMVVSNVRTDKETKTDRIVPSLKVAKGSPRKQLIVRGTYFPRKLYDTVPLQNLSEENSELLNKGFSSLLSRKASKSAVASVYDSLSAEAKNKVHPVKDANNNMAGYTFDFFKPGLASNSEEVYAFDNPNQLLADVRVPLRKKVVSKKDGNVTYSFVTLDAKDANGPLSRPEYKEILKQAGISENTFRDFLVAARPTASKSQSQLDASTYIKLRYSKSVGNITFGKNSASINELNAAIDSAQVL